MGMSLVMYGVRDSNSIQTESDLEEQIESGADTSVDLYKNFTDLSMILTNNVEPFELTDLMGFKAVMGIPAEGEFEIEEKDVIGFLTNSQATEIFDWLKSLNIDSEDKFLEFHDNLDEEVKETLIDYGSEIDELFEGYLEPLLKFYDMVVQENKAIIFCME